MATKQLNMNRRGSVLLIGILLAGALTSIAFVVSSIIYKDTRINFATHHSQRAFWAADSSLECALKEDFLNDRFASRSTKGQLGEDIICGGTSSISNKALTPAILTSNNEKECQFNGGVYTEGSENIVFNERAKADSRLGNTYRFCLQFDEDACGDVTVIRRLVPESIGVDQLVVKTYIRAIGYSPCTLSGIRSAQVLTSGDNSLTTAVDPDNTALTQLINTFNDTQSPTIAFYVHIPNTPPCGHTALQSLPYAAGGSVAVCVQDTHSGISNAQAGFISIGRSCNDATYPINLAVTPVPTISVSNHIGEKLCVKAQDDSQAQNVRIASLPITQAPVYSIRVSLTEDTGEIGDNITTNPEVQVEGFPSGVSWEYKIGVSSWTQGTGTIIPASAFAIDGEYTVSVRQSFPPSRADPITFTFTLTTTEPSRYTALALIGEKNKAGATNVASSSTLASGVNILSPSGYTHPSYTSGALLFNSGNNTAGDQAIRVSGFDLAVDETLIIRSEFEFANTSNWPAVFQFGGNNRNRAVALHLVEGTTNNARVYMQTGGGVYNSYFNATGNNAVVAVITKTASRNNRQDYSVKLFINNNPVITGTVSNNSNEETLIIGNGGFLNSSDSFDGSMYNVEVAKTTTPPTDEEARSFGIKVPSIPSAPTLTATRTSLSISWDVVESATSYDVRYREEGTTSWSNGEQDSTDRVSSITNLTPATTYEVQVRATNVSVNSAWSSSTTITTTETSRYTPLALIGEKDKAGATDVATSSTLAEGVSILSPSGYTHPPYTSGALLFNIGYGASGNQAVRVSGFNLAVNETLIINTEFEFPTTNDWAGVFQFGGRQRNRAVSLFLQERSTNNAIVFMRVGGGLHSSQFNATGHNVVVAVITKTASRNNRQDYNVKLFINDNPVITGTVINSSNEETLVVGNGGALNGVESFDGSMYNVEVVKTTTPPTDEEVRALLAPGLQVSF